MSDMKQTIKSLEKIINDDWIWKHADYYASVISDALELLKKQEQEIETLRQIVQSMMEGIVVSHSPEIVRCKYCRHRSEKLYTRFDGEEVYVCQINDIAKKPEWFCADGERRDPDA